MRKHYFSFGQAHSHLIGGKRFDRDCLVEIIAHSTEEARKIMMLQFGTSWHREYQPEELTNVLKYYPRGIIDLNENKSQGICETTSTERFVNSNCECDTYPDNLGPCKDFKLGANGRCAYCDHSLECHQEKP